MALPVEGGPFDGGRATALGGYVRWLDAHGVAHREAAEGRVPYIRESTRWRFAGHAYLACPNCGRGVTPTRPEGLGVYPSCPLCGYHIGRKRRNDG